MSLIIYHCDTSYASQKLRLYLAEKGLCWQSHHIDLRKQENITSDYRKINPHGTVPSMRDGDTIICESTEIMIYLEHKHPAPCLLSTHEPLRQRQIDFCYAHEKLHDPSIRLLSYLNIFMSPQQQKSMDIEHVLMLAKDHPWRQRGEFLERVLKNEVPQQEVDNAKQAVVDAIGDMAALITAANNGFLFAEGYCMADAVATASLFRIEKIGMLEAILADKTVFEYYQQMQQRPSFGAANML